MKLKNRIKTIETIVEKLKEEFRNFEQKKINKDVESCLENFGISVKYADYSKDLKGVIRKNESNKKPELVLNGNKSEKTRRYTMAQALGTLIIHYKWLNKHGQNFGLEEGYGLHLYEEESSKYENDNSINEIDIFAREFLLPLDDVKKRLEGKKYFDFPVCQKIEIEEELSEKYKVSNVVVRIQLEKSDHTSN